MRFNKWTAMRICKRCYTSFIPTETQQKRHNTSYCLQCSEDMMNSDQENTKYPLISIKKKK
jgi:hypothetical protein